MLPEIHQESSVEVILKAILTIVTQQTFKILNKIISNLFNSVIITLLLQVLNMYLHSNHLNKVTCMLLVTYQAWSKVEEKMSIYFQTTYRRKCHKKECVLPKWIALFIAKRMHGEFNHPKKV